MNDFPCSNSTRRTTCTRRSILTTEMDGAVKFPSILTVHGIVECLDQMRCDQSLSNWLAPNSLALPNLSIAWALVKSIDCDIHEKLGFVKAPLSDCLDGLCDATIYSNYTWPDLAKDEPPGLKYQRRHLPATKSVFQASAREICYHLSRLDLMTKSTSLTEWYLSRIWQNWQIWYIWYFPRSRQNWQKWQHWQDWQYWPHWEGKWRWSVLSAFYRFMRMRHLS